jgi:hypothetical protein
MQAAFKAVGVTLPRVSQEQRDAGVSVPLSQIQPGDLVTFTYPDSGGNPGPGNHVALYAGAGQVIEAPKRGVPVRLAPIDTAHVDRVRRVLGTSGSAGAPPQTTASTQGATASTAGLQQAGYDAVINLTPWGIPLNPFKLPGWVEGKLGGGLGGLLGGTGGGTGGKGLFDTVGVLVLATTGVVLGAGLVALGGFLTAKPAIDGVGDTIGKFNVK